MAFGNRVFQILPPNMVPICTQLVYVAWLVFVLWPIKEEFGPRQFWNAAWWRHTPNNAHIQLKPWHRALGLACKNRDFPQPMPLPIAIVFVVAYKTERCLWHLVDFALVCVRFAFTLRWPRGWSTYDPDAVMKATLCTGMGDLLYVAIIRCERAKHLGVRTVWVDWSFSSYLTDPEANVFSEVFDVVPNPEATAADPAIATDRPEGARVISIPEVYADLGHFEGGSWWRFTLAPRIYFESPPSRWTSGGEADWEDDPLDASPTPFHSTLCMPVNRGTLRRLIRDGSHFVNSIRLKQPFLSQFEHFRKEHLDGKRTVGVHVRAGNGEKGHFVIHGRGRVPIDEVHAAVSAHGKALGGEYQVLLMSDTQGYIEAYQDLKSTKSRPVITRSQWKPPAGAGAFFVAGSAMAGRISEEVCAPPAGGVQLAADAVIDMLCLAHCDVFLATGHSMFCIYPAKLARQRGSVVAQLRRPNWTTEHEGGVSFCALLYDHTDDSSGDGSRNGVSEGRPSSGTGGGRPARSPARRRSS
jgi:hypothetical protein